MSIRVIKAEKGVDSKFKVQLNIHDAMLLQTYIHNPKSLSKRGLRRLAEIEEAMRKEIIHYLCEHA